MEINTNYLKTQKTNRYCTYGNLSEHIKYFWFCLHGSNMVCEQMLYKFSEFDPNSHFVVAPEAMNRFYANGFSGDVVAAWMTKRDRLFEIEDISDYLSSLFESINDSLPENCIKTVLGFSQGGTTAFRWLNQSKIPVDLLLAYSCWIPEDINLSTLHSQIKQGKIIYTFGRQDEFLTPARIEELKGIIKQNRLSIQLEPYEGKHRISKENLQNIFENYIL